MRTLPSYVAMRPVQPCDEAALVAMFERCSPASRYARFLSPVQRMPARHLHDVLHPDGTRWSWVACDRRDGTVVALSSLFRGRGSSGEVALLVEDAWQRHGIGTALLELAAARACDVAIDTFIAVALTDSRHVRRMLERVGTVTSVTDGHTSEHRVQVCTAAARRATA
ncbi:MAG TPA: GNAT family N-acetyltransferase [Acidimicrobiia bacterium]|nr:GNAT family N-acetyltransferase [Acidimicrobiia bacterium]